MNAKDSLQRSLAEARALVARHPGDVRVSRTFSYFTRHPVAPLNQKRLKALLDRLACAHERLGRPPCVLDLACGGGLIANTLALVPCQILGLDLDPAEIALAREFAQNLRTDARFDTANLLDDPTWEKTAETALGGPPDFVVLAYALHHLPRVEEFVARLSRWLPPGTVLLINEENPKSPLFQLKHWARGWLQNDTDTEWHRNPSDWKELLSQHGFACSSRTGHDLIPGLGRLVPTLSWSVLFEATRI